MNFTPHSVAALVLTTLLTIQPLVSYADHSLPVGATPIVEHVHTEHECTIERTLTLGSRGDDVRCLQEHLAEARLFRATVTGVYGALTKAAVVAWQAERDIPSTGAFGPRSRAAFASGMQPHHTASTAATTQHPYYTELENSHKAMMAAFMSTSSSDMHMSMPDNRKIIAVVLYDEFEPLDAIGPFEVLGQLPGYKVVTVAKQKGAIASAFGTEVVADYSFDELKHPAIIVVPGGLFGTIAASKDAATLAWLREADTTSEYTTSVCTGAWILGAAGLLNGRQASTHWTGADYLEDFGVKYTGKRYTVDGKYITAAGVSAGIDMGFKLIALIAGDDAAKVAQLGLEYDPQPPFDVGSPAKADPELVRIMRGQMKDHLMAANMMFGTSTTMSMPTHDHAATTTTMSTDMHMHSGLDVSAWPSIPMVAIVMHPDAMGGWNLEITTTNFRFAPEHVNGAVLPNEGHAHLYIDGKKITRVYGNWFNISKALAGNPGEHEILVTLNANDHSDISSHGSRIDAKTTVVVQ